MGFVTLLKLLDVVAWPLITLVYPLYASIRAIESNSHAENRKWLTYWVLCGLAMLFEFTSEKLFEWIPFWPHIKLMATFWLVVPHFDGAVYAYDNFVRPCFTLNPQTFGYWLRTKQDGFGTGNSDDFLLLAERYVQEKGSEALEKLICGKVKCVEPNLATEEKNSVASMNNKEAEALKNELMESSLAQADHKAIAATENKTMTVAEVVAGDSKLPQSSSSCETQKEWTCALCQVCTPSEVVLHAHFQGKKHMAKEKELMESTLAKTAYKAVVATENTATTEDGVVGVGGGGGSESPRSSIPNEAQKEWTCALCQEHAQSEVSLHDHFQGKKHKAKERELMESDVARPDYKAVTATENKPTAGAKVSGGGCEGPGSSIPDKTQTEWTCALCQVCTSNESVLQNHFQGKKHKAKEKEHIAKQMAAKNKTTSASNSKNKDKPKVSGKEALSASSSNLKSTDKPKVSAKEALSASSSNLKSTDKPKVSKVSSLSTSSTNLKSTDKPKVTPKEGLSASIPNAKYVKKPEERRVGGTWTGNQRAQTNQNTKIEIIPSALWCDACKLQCNSLSMLMDHLGGKKHLASLQK